jgi:glycosyltransferase involved in cell wall biosynthesis
MTRDRKLHICFDARKYRDGGIGVYIQNAIYGLVRQNVRLTVLINDDDTKKFFDSFRGLDTEWPEDFTVLSVKAKPFSFGELFSLQFELDWSQFDLFHTPNYLLPFGITCPCVVTVHDLIHIRHPERAAYPFLSAPLLYSSVMRARSLVCVSRATREDVLKLCAHHPRVKRKTVVIPNALSPSFSRLSLQPELLRTRFSLTSPYFLSVLSTVKPHKGVSDLLQAFKDLEVKAEKAKKKRPQLVLVGQGTENLIKVEQLLRSADALKDVRLLGTVSQQELRQLYAQARALIVPSFREGYCLPVIEAQSVGTPVITRPIPAVLENISPQDMVCDDFTVDSLVNSVERFMEQEQGEGVQALDDILLEWQNDFTSRVDPVSLGAQLYSWYTDVVSSGSGSRRATYRQDSKNNEPAREVA